LLLGLLLPGLLSLLLCGLLLSRLLTGRGEGPVPPAASDAG